MRGIIRITVLSVLLFALPNVAAEDPSLSIPDAAAPVAAAEGTVETQRDATTAFTRASFFETSQAANEAQENDVPASRLMAMANATGDYGAAAINTTRDLAFAGYGWTSGATYTKVDEVEAVLRAGDGVGASGVTAVHVVTEAVLNVLCSPSVDLTGCEDGSILAAVQDEVEGLLDRGSEEASEDRFAATEEAALRLVNSIVPLP